MKLKLTRWIPKSNIKDTSTADFYSVRYTWIDYIKDITWNVIPHPDAKGKELVTRWFNDRQIIRQLEDPKFKPGGMKVIIITTHDSKGKLYQYVTDLSGWLLNDDGKTLEHLYID